MGAEGASLDRLGSEQVFKKHYMEQLSLTALWHRKLGTLILGLWLALNIQVDLLTALRSLYIWLEMIPFSSLIEGTREM